MYQRICALPIAMMLIAGGTPRYALGFLVGQPISATAHERSGVDPRVRDIALSDPSTQTTSGTQSTWGIRRASARHVLHAAHASATQEIQHDWLGSLFLPGELLFGGVLLMTGSAYALRRSRR